MQHPASAAAVQMPAAAGDEDDERASQALVAVVFGVLAGYGLDDEALVDATRTLRAGLVGFVALECGGAFGLDRPVDDSFDWWLHALDRALTR
jgi:hypothetical protein